MNYSYLKLFLYYQSIPYFYKIQKYFFFHYASNNIYNLMKVKQKIIIYTHNTTNY